MGHSQLRKALIGYFFAISLSFGLIGICLDVNAFRLSENSEDVMREKINLYKLMDGKKTQFPSLTTKIKLCRNKDVITDIFIYSSNVMNDNYYSCLEEKIKSGTLLDELKNNGLDRKRIKRIKNLLKYYEYTDDIEEIIRKYETRELLNKKNINIWASLIAVVGIIFAVFAFFKIDYESISLTANLILIFIVFAINVFGTFESYRRVKRNQLDYYIRLQNIIENEKINRYM